MSNDASNSIMLLGVDAGGTKTRVALASIVDGEIALRATGSAGPGNVRSEGAEVATANMMLAIERAFQSVDQPKSTMDAACLCVAGAGRPEERAAIEAWALDANLAGQVRVVSDADVLFAAAEVYGNADAIVCLIAGTGSIAIGRCDAGKTARCGGWGYLIGDRGSGYAIGRSALEAIANAIDRLGPTTELTEAVLSHLQLDKPQDLIGWCYAEANEAGRSRRRIASLAPIVFKCNQDATANRIVAQAATDLAQQVAAVCKQLEFNGPTVACTGSLLVHQSQFRDSVFEQLDALGIRDARCSLVANPEIAALRIAHALLLAK